MNNHIQISTAKQIELINALKKQNDINSQRLLRLLSLDDLSRLNSNPVKMIIDRIINIPNYKDYDIIEIPEIVSASKTFDLFNFPKDHPARSKSDTYYVNNNDILRTHTTIMWDYFLNDADWLNKLEQNWELKILSYWKVYRKDEIDRSHYPVFHQIDWLYICKKDSKEISKDDLVQILVDIAQSIYWKDIEWRVNVDSFPYTDPSIEMEIKHWDDWLEVLWSWLVHPQVLRNLDIDPNTYNWWAFWFGIERLAMIKKCIPDIRILWSNDERITSQWWDLEIPYKEISKYPLVSRDISFIIWKDINLNNYYELARDLWWDLIEEVKLLDKYENDKKFWKDRISYTFRIDYRSHTRTLTNEEINIVQGKIRKETESELWGELR